MSQCEVLLYALGMTEAVIYTRVSSREQQQEGFSLHAQSKLLRDYAQQNRLHIVQSFEDVETARATGRKQFGQMVDFFKRSSCRVLLVEKTDRITRNFRDAVTLEDLDIAVHLVKEGQVISKDSRSQAILLYGFNLVLARHYSNNLREEVKKGMREKARQGIYPGHAPFGYRNNKADRTIEVDPTDSPTVNRIFDLYATGSYSISTVVKTIQTETGKSMSPQQRAPDPQEPVLRRILRVGRAGVCRHASVICGSAVVRAGAVRSGKPQQA
jgi:site-specific DNA recombinase